MVYDWHTNVEPYLLSTTAGTAARTVETASTYAAELVDVAQRDQPAEAGLFLRRDPVEVDSVWVVRKTVDP